MQVRFGEYDEIVASPMPSGIFAACANQRIAVYVRSKFPALALPEGRRRCIHLEDVNVALENAKSFQFAEAAFDKCVRDALAPMRWKNDEMLQVPTTAIMARHDTTNEMAIELANKAQAPIPSQIPSRRFARICVPE